MFVGFMWFMYPINIHVNLMGLFNNSGYVIPIIVVIYGYMMGLKHIYIYKYYIWLVVEP